ncbi:MAG: hypothetical protein FJ405_12515, partial [Verrucomicrobia bacterium]|nr:hypothetical protein [Verrucomicrobiota bacterium]
MPISPALRFIHAVALAALTHIAFLSAPPSAFADTIVKLGAITQITGPQDLDLDGEMAYAINFSADDPIRTLAGVRFLPDNQTIPGAALLGPQQVTPWQAKPEFGNSADANALELILHDIRWANSGAGERLRATLNITNGFEYKLQILISGNGPENRRWDIRVAGREAVDEITSLGAAPSASYSVNRSTLYTYQFVANTNRLVIEMGDLFGRNDGGDRNPIWQALTLERVFIPPTPENLILTANRFFPVQTAPISDVQVVDRKSGATHTLSLVPGEGDLDNPKFMLEGNALKPGAFNFSSLPVGTAFSIRLRATDASDSARFLEKAFVLTLAAPNPPSGIALDVSSIPAPPQPGQLLALISVLDPDSFDRHQLSLDPGVGSDDNGLVRIEASQLRLTSPIPAGKSSIKVRIGASDLAGLSVSSLFELPLVASQVRINEVVAGEAGGIPDEGGNPVEWIE